MQAKLFRDIRTLNGLTQQEMARRLQISPQLVSMVEISHRKITPALDERINKEFGSDAIRQVQALAAQVNKLRNGPG